MWSKICLSPQPESHSYISERHLKSSLRGSRQEEKAGDKTGAEHLRTCYSLSWSSVGVKKCTSGVPFVTPILCGTSVLCQQRAPLTATQRVKRTDHFGKLNPFGKSNLNILTSSWPFVISLPGKGARQAG